MLIEILKHTPVWVYALFIGLLILGYVQSRPRVVSMQRAAALPIAMVAFSAYGVASAFHASTIAITGWLTGLVLGALARQTLGAPRGASYSPSSRSFALPGSWFPLALMMTIFFTRYAVAVATIFDPELRESTVFVPSVCLWYGALSGLFLSNLIVLWRLSRAAPAALLDNP